MKSFNNAQTRYLKAQAHSKQPVVLMGGKGLSEAVIGEIKLALDHHELIKIRLPALPKAEKLKILDEVCSSLNCHFIQMIGHIAILFLQHPEQSKYTLP